MKWLGITTNLTTPNHSLTILKFYACGGGKWIDLVQLPDIRLLGNLLEFKGGRQYDRILIYDISELDSWKDLRKLSDICDKYGKDFTIVKQDLHSDVEVPIGYLTSVL